MLRWEVSSCRWRHAGCDAGRSSLALADMRDVTPGDLLLHLQTCRMIRWEIFSCTCRHAGCYAGILSLALGNMLVGGDKKAESMVSQMKRTLRRTNLLGRSAPATAHADALYARFTRSKPCMQYVLKALALTRKNRANWLGNDLSTYLDTTKDRDCLWAWWKKNFAWQASARAFIGPERCWLSHKLEIHKFAFICQVTSDPQNKCFLWTSYTHLFPIEVVKYVRFNGILALTNFGASPKWLNFLWILLARLAFHKSCW